MKGAAHPRPKKPSYPQKLKLLCSFGGAFVPREPTGELRYTGGEARIVSVDRRGGVSLSKLLSRVSELRPGRPFFLSYQRPEAPSSPVPIATDDDVRRMIEDHDRLAAHGKVARLRVFLCDAAPGAGYVAPRNPISSTTRSCSRSGDPSGEKRVSGRGIASSNVNTRTHVSEIMTTHVKGVPYNGDPYESNESEQTESFVCGPVSSNQLVGPARPLCRAYNPPLVGNMNRENVIPRNVSRSPIETCLPPVSFSIQPNRRVLQSNFLGGNSGPSGIFQCRTRNHRHGGSDARYHRIGPYNVRGSQIGTRDFGVQGVRDGKLCMLNGYPRLRPRSNISKLWQGRSHQTHSAKPIDVGGKKGVLRERGLQPNEGRSLANHHNGQGSLLAVEKQELHGDPVSYHCSYLRPNMDKKSVFQFGTASVEEDLSCKRSPAEPATEYHTLWEDNPFNIGTEESLNCATSNGNDYHDLSKELCLGKPLDRGKEDTLFSTLRSLWDTPTEDAEENDTKSRDNITCPPDLTTQLDDFILCDVKSPMDLSMQKLSLCPSAELCQPSSGSPLSIGNGLEPDGYAPNVISALPIHKTRLQLNKEDMMEDSPLNSVLHYVNMAEEVDKNCSNHKSDAAELSLPGKLSQPQVSFMKQVSLGTKKDLVYNGKNQETMPFTSIMEKKENVEASTNICSKKAVETSCNLLQLYSHLPSQELQTIKNSDLEEIRKLGSGAYGTVFYGKWKGSDVAIKRLKPSCFADGELGEDRLVTDFWKEACLLAQLHHPNVVAFYGVVTDGMVPNLATVTEYMVNGSLKQVLQRKDRTIDRRKRLIIAMDAAFGMEYLHEKNVVHFDLKSHNFLVNMRDPLRPVCKIGDLGLSKVKQRTLVSGGVRGTIPWMAPELLTGKSNMVTEKVDVYSFGIVMWELLTGEEPYENMRSEEIIAGIIKGHLRPEIPSWCDPAWRSLMERCWSFDPSSRPSFSEIVKELRAIAASINIK